MVIVNDTLEEMLYEINHDGHFNYLRFQDLNQEEITETIQSEFIDGSKDSVFLFGYGPVVLDIENAFYHGHKEDCSFPINVTIFEGKKGIVVRIRDCGPGFDIKKKEDDMKIGKKYFDDYGSGVLSYCCPYIKISTEDKRRVRNIMYLNGAFLGDINDFWAEMNLLCHNSCVLSNNK